MTELLAAKEIFNLSARVRFGSVLFWAGALAFCDLRGRVFLVLVFLGWVLAAR